MKSIRKLLVKVFVLIAFLHLTPSASGLRHCFHNADDLLNNFVYKQKTINNPLSLKDSLNVLSYNSNLTIPKEDISGVEMTQDNPSVVSKTTDEQEDTSQSKDDGKNNKVENSDKKTGEKSEDKKVESTGERVYIYDTHQDESYKGGKTVLDAVVILAQKLENCGIKVVPETDDFIRYRDMHGLTYNESYVVSYRHLNETLVNYGGFDMCLDLHRDSIPRGANYINIDGRNYVEGIFVVGGPGKNVKTATKLSMTSAGTVSAKKSGTMEGVMTREAYYNQEVTKNTVLMELGGDVNTFEEVSNFLDVIADGIHDVLTKERFYMKRFLMDAILICILISIGSYTNQQGLDDTQNLVQEQVEDFESDVAQNRVVKAQNDPVVLKDIEENCASQPARSSSEVIASIMKGCVQMFSDVFDGLLHQLLYPRGRQFVKVDVNERTTCYNAY